MAKRILRSMIDKEGLRRVDIIQRDDGSYTFEEWRFSQHPHEMCWIPARQQMLTIVDSEEAAEREVRARVDWLGGDAPV